MRLRLTVSYLLLTLLVLVMLEVPLGIATARLQRSDLSHRLRLDADAAVLIAQQELDENHPELLRSVAAQYRRSAPDGRLLLVRPDGVVLADSSPGQGNGTDAVAGRPELAAALAGNQVQGVRYSTLLGQDLSYVALPIRRDGLVTAALRISYPTSYVDGRVRRTWELLAAFGLAMLALVGLLGQALANAVTSPLRDLRDLARRLGGGDLAARARQDASRIPEVRDLAGSFNDTAARLEQLVTAQQAFAGHVSHQLRTPLTVLRMRLELLEGEVAPGAAQDLAVAQSELTRLEQLVDTLLRLAVSSTLPGTGQRTDLVPFIAARVAALQPLAGDRGVSLIAVTPAVLHTPATPGGLATVLDNLVSNAVAASPAGTTVEVRADAQAGGILLRVLDRGHGLAHPPSPGGHRLGLTVVRRVVAAEGGTFRLLSRDGGGASAEVRLPS